MLIHQLAVLPMTEAKIDPLWGYWVTTEDFLTDYDRQVLLDLYQPLVGSNALSLYQLLWNQRQALVSERNQHAQLLNLLDIDAPHFYQARIKLEAVALMHTFSTKDALGQYLIYQLHEPLRPQEFFRDNILKTFLYEKIGRYDYERLQTKYQPPRLPQNQPLTDITQSFLDVFHLSSSEILKMAQQPTAKTTTKVPHYTKDQLATFDWQLLTDYTASYHVSSKDIAQHQNELFNVHAFYGVTEIEMADLIANTLNVQNNSIDIRRLQNVAQKRFEERVNIQVRDETNNQLQPELTVKDSQAQEFTKAEQQLIKQANQLAPGDFLAAKKQQLHGFVGSAETGVLRKLQQRAVLPLPVINILIDYILNNSATLTQSLVETVANDWVQNDIRTAGAAVKRIKARANGTGKSSHIRRKSARNSYQPHQEQTTDWSKHQAKQVDPEELAKLQQQWRDFKNNS